MSFAILPDVNYQYAAGILGLYGAAPGATYLANLKAYNASTTVTLNYVASAVSTDAAKLADIVVANLGLTGAAATAGKTYLEGQFKANPGKFGEVVMNSVLGLTTLAADATFGAAATATTTKLTNSVAYSTNAANTTTDMPTLKAALGNGATGTSTNGGDNFQFTALNDSVTANVTQFTATDKYEDASTNDADTLTLLLQGSAINPLANARVLNVETMVINAQGLRGVEALNLRDSAGLQNERVTPVLADAAAVGVTLDFADSSVFSGLKTIRVEGDSINADVHLRNVRDEVSVIDASKFTDDATDTEGVAIDFYPNLNGSTVATNRTITGSAGHDTIASTSGNDTINSGAGNDAVNGGAGNDSINGGAGNDILWGSTGNDTVNGEAGNDRIFADIPDGRAANNSGADSLSGGDGNDFIQVARGATADLTTTVSGGVGADFIDLAGVTGNLSVNGGNDNDQILIRNVGGQENTADYALLAGGDGGNDNLTILSDVNDAAIERAINKSTGMEGIRVTNTMTINGKNSTAANIGTAFIDATDNGANDVFNASLAGALNVLIGGTTQAVVVDLTANVTTESFTVVTGTGGDTITTGGGADSITSGAGNDSVVAGAGNDTVMGGLGFDTLDGGVGNDTVSYAGSANAVNVNLVVQNAFSIVAGADGDDVLSGFENIIGSNFADVLVGDAVANVINGGGSNDTITGNAGADTVTGGTGQDTFNYTFAGSVAATEVANTGGVGAGAFDVITDFTVGPVGDTIDFTVAGAGNFAVSAAVANGTYAAALAQANAAFLADAGTIDYRLAAYGTGTTWTAVLFIDDDNAAAGAADGAIQIGLVGAYTSEAAALAAIIAGDIV